MSFTLLLHSTLNYFFPALYLRGVVYTAGAISRDHLDSGDCQDFFLLIVPADEDLVSRNFGQDDALSRGVVTFLKLIMGPCVNRKWLGPHRLLPLKISKNGWAQPSLPIR